MTKLEKKVVNRVFEIIKEKLPTLDNTQPREALKEYAMAKAGMELSVPKNYVEFAVEKYRRGQL